MPNPADLMQKLLAEAPAAVYEWPDPAEFPKQQDDGGADYPIDALPSVIMAAASEVARFSKVPVVSPAVIGLSVAALVIGKKARIEERQGFYHHPSIFHAIIAPSGERKSPPFKYMTEPLEAYMQEQTPDHQQTLNRARAEGAVIDCLVANLRRKAGDPKTTEPERVALVQRMTEEEGKRPPLPAHPRTFTSDCTEERLFQKMSDNGGVFGVFSAEGRTVIDSIMGKYSGKDRTGDGIYLSGISGDTITRDRVGGESGPEDRVIINPCLIVCLMAQPDKYMEMANHPSLRASGALARIWPVQPPSLVGTRFEEAGEAGLNEAAMRPYREAITRLLRAQPPNDPKTGKPIPHLVQLSPEAAEARREWYNVIEAMMASGQPLDDVRDLAAKAVSSTCKAALVLHLLQNPDMLTAHRSELSLATWKNAQLLGEFHLGEAVRIQRGAGEDFITASARRIARWAVESDRMVFSVRDLQQFGPSPRLNSKDAGIVLAEMCAMGWLRALPLTGQETTPRYEVNPKLCSKSSTCSRVEG